LPDFLIAILLRTIQGLTEFLPVSSSGHLAILRGIIGDVSIEWWNNPYEASYLHLVRGTTTFIVGLISLRFLVWTLKRNTFFIFSLYCWLVGLIYLAFL
jgi:undecaprenyl pyrophosphate phosphatase UppP